MHGFFKKQKRIREKEQDAFTYQVDRYESVEDAIIADEKRLFITEAIGKLPHQDKAIMTLYYYQEESIKDIAITVGISESNVKIKLHRSRKLLHETFNNKKELLDL